LYLPNSIIGLVLKKERECGRNFMWVGIAHVATNQEKREKKRGVVAFGET